MSTIADYSVFTKKFLTSGMTDFSKLYGKQFQGEGEEGTLRAFAVIPFNLEHPLTPREAMNFDWSKLGLASASGPASGQVSYMARRVSCRDANGNFIGNIVRVQPGVRNGSIRFVAKVAVTDLVTSEGADNPADAPYNTFVLVRTNACTSIDLPIAVATISEGYNLHRHKVVVTNVDNPYDVNFADPLDDVENANYVSFTINNLNGYTSVDFNPDAYATYDDVANALSRGIDGLHIAFDTASGDLKLLDKDGNVLDQANLPIKTDVIIADGEEGYKYVKTDVKQDIHAAKAWMPEGKTAWKDVKSVPYTMKHAALVVERGSATATRVFVPVKSEGQTIPISTESVQFDHVVIGDSIYMFEASRVEESAGTLSRVKGDAGRPQYNVTRSENSVTIIDKDITVPAVHSVTSGSVTVDVVTINDSRYVLGETSNSGDSRYRTLSTGGNNPMIYGKIETSVGSSAERVLGITPDGTNLYTFDETPSTIKNSSGGDVIWLGTKPLAGVPNHTLKYGLEAFVWTVKAREVKLDERFFQQLNNSLLDLGFHVGDDIALGTNLATLAQTDEKAPLYKVDADKYMHGKDNKAKREQEVNTQRANAKEELVAWNAQHPELKEDREHGTIIDSSGLDVRNGSITLGCGRVGEAGVFQKVNYGIQMKNRSESDQIGGRSESLDFTISHNTDVVQFDGNGHATGLTSSTLLSIESGSYISGAPTCLILAKVTHNSDQNTEDGPTVVTPVRMTAGFSVSQDYSVSSGLSLTIHDYRENIKALLNHDGTTETAPSIIEVQAIYTHRNAETVPAQQMHTYIGEWDYSQTNPVCSFLCNKIEEWMTAVGLTDTNPSPDHSADVKLYVVIRVY